MASCASGQDKSVPESWLATLAGKLGLSCLLKTTCRVPQEKLLRKSYNKSSIDHWSLFGQDGWIMTTFFFCKFIDLASISVHKHEKKLGQYPAILPHTWSIIHVYVHKQTWPTFYYQLHLSYKQSRWPRIFLMKIFLLHKDEETGKNSKNSAE